jgi:signal transduction histidine kinase
MENLISDLLLYARAGQDTEKTQMVSMNEIISDLIEFLNIPEGFSIHCSPDLPRFVTAKSPLEQVFRNLINNAITHHDKSRGIIHISCQSTDNFYEFQVVDDGPGIPEDEHQEVFKMFHKSGSGDESPGTGIGLALVKRIVETQGGDISIEPRSTGGTAIYFTWPKE